MRYGLLSTSFQSQEFVVKMKKQALEQVEQDFPEDPP